MDQINKYIAKRIKDLREAARLTQTALAAQLEPAQVGSRDGLRGGADFVEGGFREPKANVTQALFEVGLVHRGHQAAEAAAVLVNGFVTEDGHRL